MRGSVLIEILCAMTIGIIVLSGILLATFGEDSSLVSSARVRDLSHRADSELGHLGSLGRSDFNLLYATSNAGDISIDTDVQLLDDLVTKRVSVRAWYSTYPGLSVEYATLVSDLENIESPDTCDATAVGDWSHPHRADYTLRTLIGTTTGTYTIGDIDVFMHRLYIGIESRTLKTDPSMIVLDVSDQAHPALAGMITTSSTTAGISALRAVHKVGQTHIFAAASGNFAKGQLQILDTTDPAHMSYPSTYKIPLSHVPTAGNGKSIFYRDGYVYLGLTAGAAVAEFSIIDVRDPSTPAWVGGYHVGNSVESISVRGSRAYLATDDNTREFMMMDVQHPSSPYLAAAYDAPGSVGSGYGRSLFIRGDRAYFGRTWVINSGTPEYLLLELGQSGIWPIASRDVGTNAHPYGIYGSLVRSDIAYLLTKAGSGGQLMIIPIGDESRIGSIAPLATMDLPSGSSGAALDCEENVIYVASNDPSGAGIISIVTPG